MPAGNPPARSRPHRRARTCRRPRSCHPNADHSRKRRYGSFAIPNVQLTTKRTPGTNRPQISSTAALSPSSSSALATLSLCLACSSWSVTRFENRRAIQYSAESPSTAPTDPASITSQMLSAPCAASVEAAFSVVSPGNTGQTASRNTRPAAPRYDEPAWAAISPRPSPAPECRTIATTTTTATAPSPTRTVRRFTGRIARTGAGLGVPGPGVRVSLEQARRDHQEPISRTSRARRTASRRVSTSSLR